MGTEVNGPPQPRQVRDWPFFLLLGLLGGTYVILVVAMLLADVLFTDPANILYAFRDERLRYSIRLTMISCSLTTILCLWVAVPLGYLMSRFEFYGKSLLDAILDIPIVLPPLVIGLSLLILFRTGPGLWLDRKFDITFEVPSIIIAQFAVSAAFAVRTMRVTFDQISPRLEQVALTLGCSRGQAFWRVVLPEARRGVLTAATLAWARALGEFGPILVFSGSTRMKTEVMSTSVFLELNIGNLHAAIGVSLLMVFIAILVLILMRVFGLKGTGLA